MWTNDKLMLFIPMCKPVRQTEQYGVQMFIWLNRIKWAKNNMNRSIRTQTIQMIWRENPL